MEDKSEARKLHERILAEKVLEIYDASVGELKKSLNFRGLREKFGSVAEAVALDEDKSQSLLDMAVGLKNYAKNVEEEILRSLDKLLPFAEPAKKGAIEKKAKKVRQRFSDLPEAVSLAFTDHTYRKSGVGAKELLGIMSLSTRYAGALTNYIRMQKDSGHLQDCEFRDGRIYPLKREESKRDVVMDDASRQEIAPPDVEIVAKRQGKKETRYSFPSSVNTKRLESFDILKKLYGKGEVEIDSGFRYGSPKGRDALKQIYKDVKKFMLQAGFRKNPDIHSDWSNYKIRLGALTYGEFRKIVDSRN